MMLSRAIAAFIQHTQKQAARPAPSLDYLRALELLSEYCARSSLNNLEELTRARLGYFLTVWYIEQASTEPNNSPAPAVMIETIASFLKWADQYGGEGFEAERLPAIADLEERLNRALAIYSALSDWLADRGGAFSFPEFLTSFEEGGRSLYDIDAPGDCAAKEGYFRVVRVGDESAEVEDLLTEDRIEPVIIPGEVARIIDPGYIINLEIVRIRSGWQVAGCGFVYPPEAEF
ncbi:MAG TPA: hypothetical protein VFQ92_19645 [Blastocatellia bacterium]|nr:hypothetical protein [Blastocatellia bacterium]